MCVLSNYVSDWDNDVDNTRLWTAWTHSVTLSCVSQSLACSVQFRARLTLVATTCLCASNVVIQLFFLFDFSGAFWHYAILVSFMIIMIFHDLLLSPISAIKNNDNKLIIEHKLCQGQNLNQKWSGIRIWISRLIWIQIQMSAGSLTICCAFIVSVSHFAKCRKNRPVTDCMRNAKKSMIPYSTAARQNGKVNQKSKNPHPYSDKHQNLITSRGSHFALSFFTR